MTPPPSSPRTPEQLAHAVSEALQAGDRAGFVSAMTGLLDSDARMVEGWKSLTQPLLDFGEFDLARRSIARYVAAHANAPTARFEQALVLIRTGRPADAQALLETIPRTVPDAAGNAFLRGTIALNLGQRDAARAALLDAVAARPGAGQIWQTLSMLGSMADDADTGDRIIAAERTMRAAPEAERAPYFYALGKTLDDRGEIDRAFAAFAEGAAIVARERRHDHAADEAVAARATAGWTAPQIAALAARVGEPTDRAVVVTGLPRSGTTLVEHIIASHSSVGGGDELNIFAIVAGDIGGVDAASASAWVDRHGGDAGARRYFALADQRFGAARFVDKTIEASRYLGAFAALLPEAPIIWMRRDPLDNAWSAFHTWFLSGVPWSWAQDRIAAHFQLEDALLAQWRDILGDRLMVVDYQQLVTDKQAMIPRITGHCGLTMEPQVLTPEKSQRLVTTASVTQVRAPINTRAVGAGQRYAKHLAPFIEAYGYRG